MKTINSTLRDLAKHSFGVVLLTGILAISGVASAKDLLGSLKGDSKTSEEKPAEQAPADVKGPMVNHFVTSYGSLLSAQMRFAEAFDLKDQVSLLSAERESLSSGAVDSSGLKKVKSTSETAQKEIDARMAEEKELSTEGKKTYTAGLLDYAKALLEASKTVKAAEQFTNAAKGNPQGLLSTEGRTASYVAKEAPGYASNLQSSSKLAISFAQRNKIEVPKEATSALDGM